MRPARMYGTLRVISPGGSETMTTVITSGPGSGWGRGRVPKWVYEAACDGAELRLFGRSKRVIRAARGYYLRDLL